MTKSLEHGIYEGERGRGGEHDIPRGEPMSDERITPRGGRQGNSFRSYEGIRDGKKGSRERYRYYKDGMNMTS